MKPPSNSILGIKMSFNENDVVELNDVFVEANILIYYMSKTELRMQSFKAMNMSTWIWDFET